MWSTKGFQLEASVNIIIKLKWNAQGKGITYLGFPSFTGLMVLGGRPDYRFDSRTIKRDYRTSSLVTSYVECSNLCIFLYRPDPNGPSLCAFGSSPLIGLLTPT